MIKKILTISSIFILASLFTGCASDEEKCKDGNLDACQRVLQKTADNLNKSAEQFKKEMDGIQIPQY